MSTELKGYLLPATITEPHRRSGYLPIRLHRGLLRRARIGAHEGWLCGCDQCGTFRYALGVRQPRADKRFCSTACRVDHHRHPEDEYAERARRRYYQGDPRCRVCRRFLDALCRRSRQYCSAACRQAAYRRRLIAPGDTPSARPLEVCEDASSKAAERFLEASSDTATFSRMIKPTDCWNFSPVVYGRIDDGAAAHGYIPGDLYANILWWWSRDGDWVCAPMAGAGQIFRVYEDRARWMGPEPWELDIEAFDLTPRGPYADRIGTNDALVSIPSVEPDLIVADLPYFGMCRGVYSDNPADLGNMGWPAYVEALGRFAANCAAVQRPEQRAVIVTAARFVEHKTRTIRLLDEAVEDAFCARGYHVVDQAFSTRRIQQTQSPTMARLNNRARELKLPLSDMLVVLALERG